MIEKFMKITVIPLVIFGVLLWLGQYFYMVDGEVDWFRAMLILGVPFGIPYMFFVIPIRGSVSWITVILLLNVIVGSVFGIFIAGWVFVKAIVNIPVSVLRFLSSRHKFV